MHHAAVIASLHMLPVALLADAELWVQRLLTGKLVHALRLDTSTWLLTGGLGEQPGHHRTVWHQVLHGGAVGGR